ncbi:hypothetical protein GCM10009096_19850 [Parasphingorhabdus litoris]|uniref:Methyltransferase type 12 domain-containing protein n=1 Tax=Parasphingorhabdus litoris TaxID=394733 RepID=A0ABN1AK13_9SPHN|nr:class I SAM-dependent methyltransferase [Parasphingorhabdus litoris]
MAPISNDAAFWSKRSRKYAANPIGDMDGYLNTLERTKSYLKPGDTALEIGCGTGSTALLLAPHVKHITATDIAPGMIEIANEKLVEEGLNNVTFAVAEVKDHSTDDSPYDVVMAHNLLHLVTDLDSALAHIRALVKPGGLFISKTVCAPYNAGLKFALIRYIAIPIMQAIGKAPFVEFMSANALEGKIKAAGFKIIETGDQNGMLLSRYLVVRKA